jgi:hypothetical protein
MEHPHTYLPGFNPPSIRQPLCFCEETDVNMVTNFCNKCNKYVIILNWRKYKMQKCLCGIPILNVAFFCENCKGYMPKSDGEMEERTRILVERTFNRNNALSKLENGLKK